PGMKYTHYSPDAEVIVVSGSPGRVAEKVAQMAAAYAEEGMKVGILATSQTASGYSIGTVINAGDRTSTETIASNLFNALREFDRMKVDVVIAESVDSNGLGHAIMNRQCKAAGYNIIDV